MSDSNTLYLQCHAGISGDMLVGCLLDLGADRDHLVSVLNTLPLEGYRIEIKETKKAGLRAVDFDVVLSEEYENHDHDMEYLYGGRAGDQAYVQQHHHEDSRPAETVVISENSENAGFVSVQNPADFEREGKSAARRHSHTKYADIRRIIGESGLSDGAKELAMKIFTILGEAEAAAHASTLEEVVFHEVGAVDSIVDIAAVAVCIDNMGIRRAIIGPLSEGEGTVRCAHGVLPIPVPAVCQICAEYGLTIHPIHVKGEFVTPTGAACAAALKTSEHLPESYRIKRTGYGAGKREHKLPGILRGMLIEEGN